MTFPDKSWIRFWNSLSTSLCRPFGNPETPIENASAVPLLCVGIFDLQYNNRTANETVADLLSIIIGVIMLLQYFMGMFTQSIDLCCCISCGIFLLIPLQLSAMIISYANMSNNKNILALGIIQTISIIFELLIALTTIGDTGWGRFYWFVRNIVVRPFGVHSYNGNQYTPII
ncbi:uncharacterized protein LOC128960156 [Oppia nitens]|uniref:uncharacterized protein LOC128960156 n=1 Tax=Oppia nitens TaxID=1686743 RepID=UPI0023DAAB26|nr:uncharacterized protein LOC128960156 [Oppia nitens]